MLLQAVVRERATRALESLLASASAPAIVAGKLIGVGLVSLLVLGSWLAAAAALGQLAPSGGGQLAAILRGMAEPRILLLSLMVYPLGYAFYGLVTIAVGARARDAAAAQNLARPMFAVLLAAFFITLASAGGAQSLEWLSLAPPFSPFLLIIGPTSPAQFGSALVLLIGSTAAAGWAAVKGVRIGPGRLAS